MSEEPAEIDPQQEEYVYAVTRRLFKYTMIGTVLFSATILCFWYFFA